MGLKQQPDVVQHSEITAFLKEINSVLNVSWYKTATIVCNAVKHCKFVSSDECLQFRRTSNVMLWKKGHMSETPVGDVSHFHACRSL